MFHSTSSSVKLFITLSTKFFARGSKGGLPVNMANISSSSSDDEEESSNSLISLFATNKAAVVSIFARSQKPPSARRKQKINHINDAQLDVVLSAVVSNAICFARHRGNIFLETNMVVKSNQNDSTACDRTEVVAFHCAVF